MTTSYRSSVRARTSTTGRLLRVLAADLCWLLVPLACAPEPKPATAIVVSIKTDLTVGSELTELSCRVFAADADPDLDRPVSEYTTAADAIDRPFVIVKGRAPELLLSIEGFRVRGAAPVVTARVRARFEEEKTLALPVFLARACTVHRCLFPGSTCFGQPSGATPAGECAAIPGPDSLREVSYPGEEAAWTPLPAPLFDAGLPAPFDAGSPVSQTPRFDAAAPPSSARRPDAGE